MQVTPDVMLKSCLLIYIFAKCCPRIGVILLQLIRIVCSKIFKLNKRFYIVPTKYESVIKKFQSLFLLLSVSGELRCLFNLPRTW